MRADLGEYAIAYELGGAGDEVIALSHGLGVAQTTFAELAARLGRDYRVLTFDTRGHGESDSPDGPWTIAELAEDITRLIDHLGLERIHLVGHSLGGVLSMMFALARPSRLKSLVLACTASQANEKAAAVYETLAQKAEREGIAAIAGSFDMGGAASRPPDPSGFAKVSRCMATLYPAPLTPRLGEIKCPVLILGGDLDVIVGRGPAILHKNIPGSRLEILEGLGHAIYLEDPDRVERSIRAHVQASLHPHDQQ